MSPPALLHPVAPHKMHRAHYDRLAAVSVRPSPPPPLSRPQESTRLPYDRVERALALGWAQPHGLVIDEDGGKSADRMAGRSGFPRLVAAVSLAQGGIIVGLARSRLARAKRAWPPRLAVCALFGTLLGDLDGMYDPTDDTDRLGLGLQGAMRAAALPVLQQRLMAGTRAQAARGALGRPVPMGYVRRPSGEVAQEPAEQAQAVMARICDQWARVGTIHAV